MYSQTLMEVCDMANNKIKHLNLYITPFLEEKHSDMVSKLTEECFKYFYISMYHYGLLLLDSQSGKLLSYMMFDIKITSTQELFLALEFGCTSSEHRKKGFSTYLRMCLFYYAVIMDFAYIASNTNENSLSLLKRYGFKGEVDNSLELFNYEYTTYVKTDNKIFREKIYQFFF